MGPTAPVEKEENACDVCGQLAQVVVKGGHDGKRTFYYCNRHAIGTPVEVDDD